MSDLSKNTYEKEYVRIKIWLFLNLLLYIVIECISSFNPLERFQYLLTHVDIFLINYIILLIITCPCLLFTKMTFVFNLFAVGILSIVYASRILMVIRGMPLRWPDFFIAKEGLSIANKYLSFDIIMLIIILVMIGLFFLAKSYSCHLNIYHPMLMVCFIILITSLNLTVISKAQKKDTSEVKESIDYSEEGPIYSFVASYEAKNHSMPENYSEQSLRVLQEKLRHQPKTTATDKKPNIIFLQVESFIDPLTLKNISYSKDPIPNMRKYMTGDWCGSIEVPGINTARTEFEILTGMRIAQLFKYEVPYTSDALDGRPIESIVHVLKKYKKYHTTAIHNHEGSFYKRDEVYKVFGFDHFIPIEYMEGAEYTKNWPKDNILLKYIQETLQATSNRDFIFTVTVGTHSSYDYDYEGNTSDITITGDLEDPIRHQIQDYIDRLAETDQFVGALITFIYQLKEPTVLVVYSDHIPALDSITYDEDYIKDQVPYFIVSNYKLRGKAAPLIPTYKLYTQVLDSIGIRGGIISSVHHVFEKEQDYFQQLDLAAYDLLMGERYITQGKDLYPTSALQLGMP
ncbi:LTA synthase family protein [Cellulosilyticum sp. I15G10I2]|uniref:LTA synthase family protein n=1 Tax=Cellulosilyticum sp. I15G10I2 TaxID=1892843 RepID=UPI00085BDF3F|nr:LTA synthase family protein [Cellulosilyticum sp. I15G10I2]